MIEPLNLGVIIVQLFSENFKIFTTVSLIAIFGLSAYFKMTALTMFFMLGMFLIMFSGYVDPSLYFIVISIGSVLLGYVISKIVK